MKHLTWDDVVAEALRFPVEPVTVDGKWTDGSIAAFRKMNPFLSLAGMPADPAAAVSGVKE